VRGNHDSSATQRAVAAQPNAVALDGNAVQVAGLRFWGAADERYTPDRSSREATGSTARLDSAAIAASLEESEPPQADVALVHDPAMADELGGLVPLVLAGHTHEATDDVVGDTRLLVEGSTGGAGLRGLQGDEALPLTCSVLYFDRDQRRLLAYDRITVEGLGGTGAVIERTILRAEDR
jgi:predicted phosphodiesterase